MPRRPRVEVPGGVFHITTRANDGAGLYLDGLARVAFLRILARTVERFGWRCYAYCLMSNHYHLVVETPEPNRAAGMRHLNGSYAQYVNERTDGLGHVFGQRYRPTPVERESHLIAACRYVVRNPVRGGICRVAADWRWSSFRATVGLIAMPAFLYVAPVLGYFANSTAAARSAFGVYVDAPDDEVGTWSPDMAADLVPGPG